MGNGRLKRRKSLNRRIIVFIILCWAAPIILFFTFTTISYQEGIIKKSEAVLEDQLINVASFASVRIEDAITVCQKPSYERVWEKGWKGYQKGELSEVAYLREVSANLKGKFYLDERFNLSAYYQKDTQWPNCYSSRSGASYNDYMEDINPEVQKIMEDGSNYTQVAIISGRLFIVRNLYTTVGYKPFGTLVVELNKNQIFKDISPEMRNQLVVSINATDSVLTFIDHERKEEENNLIQKVFSKYDTSLSEKINVEENHAYLGYLYQKKYENYHMGVVMLANREDIYSSLYDLYRIVILMAVMLLPVLLYCIYFLRKQIQMPVRRLVEASKELEEGKIGVLIEGNPMPNEEFGYLRNSFNSMSSQVKYLFDTVYTEKLARKDAQIAALQAQINPHFLNNTLEMMNWQARMNQDVVVSKMIEALGTVLDYRMNRSNAKEIRLSEELRCTDAYFYIMSMRFGQRLAIEKKVDDELNNLLVPPLILQPLVENAIIHGVETVKSGVIRVHIYQEEGTVFVKVKNTGKPLAQRDIQRIEEILSGAQIDEAPGKHTSIGIRNVNQRIQLVYGDKYGLTISQEDGNLTVSTITLPLHQ